MLLRQRVDKAGGAGTHRERTVERTWQSIAPHLLRVGVTRVADITGLDRIGIPVYNAIAPRSHDDLSVYNGKGVTPLAARTSAVMEAVERFAAALPQRPVAIATHRELVDSGRNALDPGDCLIEPHPRWSPGIPISWVEGHDLLADRPVLVPAFLAGYHLTWHELPCSLLATTNGIASGNSLEEAICHALAEVIERDDWTIADLVSNRLSCHVSKADAARLWQLHAGIEIDSLPESALRLVEMYDDAGISLRLKNISAATGGIPSVLAISVEEIAPTFSHGHSGNGTHPDAEVALLRAITEAAQSRAVDIQAMREDISLPGTDVHPSQRHTRRESKLKEGSWLTAGSPRTIRFQDLPSYPSDDVIADIDLMLGKVVERGLNRVIAIDLSPPGIPASVARVIVPGMESWSIDHSRIGARATAAWNSAARSLELESA